MVVRFGVNIAHKLLRMAITNKTKFSWPSRVKVILDSIGLSNVFETPNAFSGKWLSATVKQKLTDQ